MKFVLIIYLVISGVGFCWKGLRLITSAGHFGEPLGRIFEEDILRTSAAGDARKKKELEDGFTKFKAHRDEVSRENFEGGLLLGSAGALHLTIGSLWCFAACMRRSRKEPNQHLRATEQGKSGGE